MFSRARFPKFKFVIWITISVVAAGILIGLIKLKFEDIKFQAEFQSFPVPDRSAGQLAAVDHSSAQTQAQLPLSQVERHTAFYDLNISKWKLPFLTETGVSGPFSVISEDSFLFISRCGVVSRVNKVGQKMNLQIQRTLSFQDEIFCENTSNLPLAGVKGMLFDSQSQTLFVSYHFMEKPNCVALRLSKMQFDPQSLVAHGREVIFQSRPCIDKKNVVFTQAGGVFAANPKSGEIFFSVGDFGPLGNAQNTKITYGGIWTYQPKTNSSSRLAIGSRNAQGLDFSDLDSVLYESEHGPVGGDEINTIESGDNLGWSRSSYGLDFDFKPGPAQYSNRWGKHDFGKKPLFVFFPSDAITGLRVYPMNSHFINWGNDLILTSLKGNSIFRLKVDGKKIVYSEPLANLNERLRSVAIADNGHIFVKADPDVFFEIKMAKDEDFDTYTRGKALSESCFGCHGVTSTAPNIFGQPRDKILATLNAFYSGERKSEVMNNVVKSLNLAKREALATYFSKSKGN